MCCAVSALGNSMPPMLIFHEYILKGKFSWMVLHLVGPYRRGSISDWLDMTSDNFLVFLKLLYTKAMTQKLYLWFSYETTTCTRAISLSRGWTMPQRMESTCWAFVPHCSHKMQPLDCTVYGPLKKYYHTACDNWMYNNTGKTMTIYGIASSRSPQSHDTK